MGKINLIEHFPYPSPRSIQAKVIDKLSSSWNDFDVFVVVLPTAWGKTALSKTIQRAFPSTSVVTPTNQLVTQYLEEFPDTPSLSRLDSYRCEDWARPCSTTRSKLLSFCKGCPAGKALSTAKYRRGPGVYNYHTYLAHKIYRDVLVVDEAHNLMPTIRDRLALRIWQHDLHYPSGAYSALDLANWIRTLPERTRRLKKVQLLWEAVTHEAPDYVVQRATDPFNGKGTTRGRPEDRDCIRLLPVDISAAPPMFWPGLGRRSADRLDGSQPSSVGKVVLLSATIGSKDIEALGLSRHRVLYIHAESPIPAERRPIVPVGLLSVNRSNLVQSAETIARYLEDVVLPQHAGQKGLVHATYQLAGLLRSHLAGNPRFLFHSKGDKQEVYEKFRASSPESGTVLVGCGLYEGVDLPEDLGRFQVVTKIPWESLGSPAVRYMADRDPEGYAWGTVRTLVQACGRISRTPTDHGITLVLDSTLDRLLGDYPQLFPAWWLDALLEGRKLL